MLPLAPRQMSKGAVENHWLNESVSATRCGSSDLIPMAALSAGTRLHAPVRPLLRRNTDGSIGWWNRALTRQSRRSRRLVLHASIASALRAAWMPPVPWQSFTNGIQLDLGPHQSLDNTVWLLCRAAAACHHRDLVDPTG